MTESALFAKMMNIYQRMETVWRKTFIVNNIKMEFALVALMDIILMLMGNVFWKSLDASIVMEDVNHAKVLSPLPITHVLSKAA